LQSVLELEAAVQRNPHDAGAWYELGVRQQENEREHKAVQALQRAVELDPTHLASWLALAISHGNDSNRAGTYAAMREWVDRNDKYRSAPEIQAKPEPSTMGEQFNQLIERLIMMARSDTSGTIDADIQIALAVLLNTNEVSERCTLPHDCRRM
jgi:peroxin-5